MIDLSNLPQGKLVHGMSGIWAEGFSTVIEKDGQFLLIGLLEDQLVMGWVEWKHIRPVFLSNELADLLVPLVGGVAKTVTEGEACDKVSVGSWFPPMGDL